jgi:hydrogenase-4 component E
MRDFRSRREVEPFVGYTSSLVLGILALGAALWLSRRLPAPESESAPYMMPAALFSIFAGLILIVSRRKAVTQVLGYLVMENGIYVAGLVLVPESAFLVELGVLLDLLVGIFLMGIMVFHIQREFDHIDTDRLSSLSEWKGRPS